MQNFKLKHGELFMGLFMLLLSIGYLVGAADRDIGKLTLAFGYGCSAICMGFGLHELSLSVEVG